MVKGGAVEGGIGGGGRRFGQVPRKYFKIKSYKVALRMCC